MIWNFDNIKASLENDLSQRSNWANIFFYGVISRLLDVVAYILEKFNFVVELFFRESAWATALLLKSLANLAFFLSYKIKRKRGASGNLEVSIDPTFSNDFVYTGNNIPLDKYTVLTDDTGNQSVYLTQDYTYQFNQQGPLTLNVKEGIPKEFLHIALGNIEETIEIYSDSIDNDEIEVFVVDSNNNVLANVGIVGTGDNPDRLYFANDLDTYYCDVNNLSDFQGIRIQFGNGIQSRKLETNERILIKYVDTQGSLGNITSANIITKFKEPVLDNTSTEVTLYVNQNEAISDGADVDDIEDVRNNAPNLFFAGYRCNGENDWETILNDISYIYKSLTNVSDDEPNTVFVTAISSDGNSLTQDQQDDTVAFLKKDKKSLTERVEWNPLNVIWTQFESNAVIADEPFSTVSGEIYTALENEYGILNTDFQKNIYESNYTCVIDSLDNVLRHTTELYHIEKNTDNTSFPALVSNHLIKVSKTAAEEPNLDKQVLIKPLTTSLWLERKSGEVFGNPFKIGEDVGGTISGLVGDMIPPNTYEITNSSVDYVNNLISFNVTTLGDIGEYGLPDIDYRLHIGYKAQDGNGENTNDIRLKDADQITNIESPYQLFTLQYEDVGI
jgi:hypothetical protein